MGHAPSTTFSGSQQPSAETRAYNRRETEGPGISSVHRGRLTDPRGGHRPQVEWSVVLALARGHTKKDGSFRMCGDYRRLNTVTMPDRYSIPLIADLTARLHGRKFFGKVDLVKGYHQIPVAEEDIAKTAITTPFGTFEFLRMPIRAEEHRADVSEDDGRNPKRPRLPFCIHG